MKLAVLSLILAVSVIIGLVTSSVFAQTPTSTGIAAPTCEPKTCSDGSRASCYYDSYYNQCKCEACPTSTASPATTAAGLRPDLVVGDVSWSPTGLYAGSRLEAFTMTVKNFYASEASAFTVKVVVADRYSNVLCQVEQGVGALAGNSHATYNLSAGTCPELVEDYYLVTGHADTTNSVDEASEYNNYFSKSLYTYQKAAVGCPSYKACADGSKVPCYLDNNVCNCKECPVPCPTQPVPTAEQHTGCQQLIPKYDSNRCVVGWECLSRTQCPSEFKCADGTVKPCYSKENTCFCEPCETRLSSGCERKVDEFGTASYVCRELPQCPPLPMDAINKCLDTGGSVTKKIDPAGCPFAYCDFSGRTEERTPALFGYTQCPAEEEFARAEEKCKTLGLPYFVGFEGGCKIPRCGERPDVCPSLRAGLSADQYEACVAKCRDTYGGSGSAGYDACVRSCSSGGISAGREEETIEEARRMCEAKGWRFYKEFSNNGCPVIRCQPDNYCIKDVPEVAVDKCREVGGEMVVKKDGESGCINFVNCVHRGDVRNIQVEPPKEKPDTTVLLRIATVLENLKIALKEMKSKIDYVVAYYESAGLPDAEKYKRVSTMLDTTIRHLDDIKTDLRDRLDTLTLDDLTKLKRDIAYIKEVILKDILYLMLSKSEDVTNIGDGKDCGSDDSCFEEAFRVCRTATFRPSGEEGLAVEISGLDGGHCLLKVRLKVSLIDTKEMTCRIPDYALGISGPEDLLPHCTGDMADKMREFGGAAILGLARFPPSEGGPGGCQTIPECARYCYDNYEECVAWAKHHPIYGTVPAKERLLEIADRAELNKPIGLPLRGGY